MRPGVSSFLLILSLSLCGCKENLQQITLRVTHRIFLGYQEEFSVKPGEKFQLSDSEYSAVVAEFVPDFAIDTTAHRVISRSQEVKNPAVKVIVYKEGKKVEEVWAFRKGAGPPHFSPRSFLAFEILELKLKTGETLQPPDSSDTK